MLQGYGDKQRPLLVLRPFRLPTHLNKSDEPKHIVPRQVAVNEEDVHPEPSVVVFDRDQFPSSTKLVSVR